MLGFVVAAWLSLRMYPKQISTIPNLINFFIEVETSDLDT